MFSCGFVDDGDGKGYEKHEVKKEGFVSKLKETGIFSDEELARLAEVDK